MRIIGTLQTGADHWPPTEPGGRCTSRTSAPPSPGATAATGAHAGASSFPTYQELAQA